MPPAIDAELQALSHPLGLSPEAAQDDAAEVDKALEAALEDGSYWVEQRQVAAFLLGTIARCAVASPLRWLPHEIVQRIAQMAFRPRHHVRFELPDRRMPPAVREAFLARGGQCLVFPCAPTYLANWEDSLLAEWGPEEIPYPSIRLPAASHVLYIELLLDDAWNGSTIHVHDTALVLDEEAFSVFQGLIGGNIPDERGREGTVVQAWQDCWRNRMCSSWHDQVSSVEERLMPWKREHNYAVNRKFWRHVTTGETTWEPPLASPPDWRSLCPCKCTTGCARVTLGLLVDLSAGFVTFRLNGVNGPRVPLGEGWQDGVEVRLGGSWPEPSEEDSWQAAIEQPLCVPVGLYASPLLGPEWEPEEDSQGA